MPDESLTHGPRDRRLASIVLALFLLAGACGKEPERTVDPWSGVDVAEVWRLGARGIGLCEQHEFEAACEEWRKVIELVPSWYTARINLGIALLNRQRHEDETRRVFEDVLDAFPGTPWAHYCLGILDEQAGDLDSAEEHYRAVLAADGDDPDTLLRLGLVYSATERFPEAVDTLKRSLSGNPLLVSAWYALAEAAEAAGDDEIRRIALNQFGALREGAGGEERAIVFGKMGFYADPIGPDAWDLPPPPKGPPAAAYAVILADASREAGLDVPSLRHGGPGQGFFSAWLANAAVSGDYGPETSGGVAAVDYDLDGDMDVFAAHWGEGPDVLALENDGGGRFADRARELELDREGPARTIALAAADFDGDGLCDLFVGRDGADLVLARERAAGAFSRVFRGTEGPDEPTLSAAVGDVDLDGDLDLLVGRHGGPALYRWIGQAFEDVTRQTNALTPGPAFGMLLGDVDGDDDLDLVAGSPVAKVVTNERLLRFHKSGRDEFGRRTTFASCSLGDVDANGLVDWLVSNPSKPTELYLAQPDGTYVADASFAAAGPPPAFSAFVLDVDRDGDLDVLSVGAEPGLLLRGADGEWSTWTEQSGLAALAPAFASARGSVPFDADGDGDLDLFVVRNGDTPLFVRNETETGPRADWIGVLPRGVKDRSAARGRSLGPGAAVEIVAAGTTYRGYSALGGGFASVAPETLYFCLAGAERADVRIRWADLVLQTEVDLAGGRVHDIEQVDREASSCPVVFYWDGRSFAYCADFLGGGGLGFLVAPGVYGEPDPEEVLLLGEDLAPKDGAFEVRVTEPMEETSFLDRVRLLQVEHAPGTLAIPEERFATDGRPATGRVLVVREDELVRPQGARVTSLEPFDGRRHVTASTSRAPTRDATNTPVQRATEDDLVLRLARVDRSFVGPPLLHRRLLGYAGNWALELAFPADALPSADAGRRAVHLFAHGWVEYPYSRLNYAAAQEGLRAEPPSLEVPDGRGGWRTVRAEFGYMGGKSRTLVLPIGEYLEAMAQQGLDATSRSELDSWRRGDTLVFRLRTNLPVYFDELYLGVDRSATDLVAVHELAPISAEVDFCGFPRVYSPDGAEPDLFDYSNRDRTSDFKSMPGVYTAFGDALELVLDADDRFAIFGRGEEIKLRFDPPAGDVSSDTKTTWMLSARGYCKDMCPLSSNPDGVEPLPFADMGNYPPEQPLDETHPSLLSPLNTRIEPARAHSRTETDALTR